MHVAKACMFQVSHLEKATKLIHEDATTFMYFLLEG